MAKKSALGKGIASLIKTNSTEALAQNMEANAKKITQSKEKVPSPKVETNPSLIAINSIKVNPYQPRKIFKDRDIKELSDSIKENGIIQPLVVIQKEGNHFELIAGERRLRASKMAGLKQVPVIVKRATDKEKLVLSIIENVQRSDLNCVEEALAYYQLMDEFKLTQEEVAKKIGKERSTIANFLRLLKLPREVVGFLQKEELSFGHGKVLAAVKDSTRCVFCATTAIEQKLSVRELEEFIKKSSRSQKAPTKTQENKERFQKLRDQLESVTGFHFDIKSKGNGPGKIIINFNNEAEFNDVFEYLVKSRKQ